MKALLTFGKMIRAPLPDKIMKNKIPVRSGRTALVVAVLLACAGIGRAATNYVLSNLRAFPQRLPVGDPAVTNFNREGPKGLTTCDLNADGRPDFAVANFDGTVTVYFNQGGGQFAPPLHLHTSMAQDADKSDELRGITCADLNGDGRPDLAAASPSGERVFIFFNEGGGNFRGTNLLAWKGARNLIAGDFNGDGLSDLAVAGPHNGVRQYQGTGSGQFFVVTNLTELNATNGPFPKPVYSMKTLRPAGLNRDELVVTHAESDLVWILAANSAGQLQIQATITNQTISSFTNQEVHSIDVGPITRPATNALADLVTAVRDLGTIEIRAGVNTSSRFASTVSQTIHVAGGPRALQIVDLDGDGWNDLVVVLRYFNCVRTYRNSNGVLVAANEMPVGNSPREVVAADFSGDGRPDVAVMNRSSEDVSLLTTYPGQVGFWSLDQFYPACGEVSGLAVNDLNSDGHADVIQLHLTTDDFSVRLANADGSLGPPAFYEMGPLPNALALKDINRDGILDVATANLGRPGLSPGSVSVRYGLGNGVFGPEHRFEVPANISGRLFGLEVADFDGDGLMDLVVGFLDCRIAFYHGKPDGTLELTGAFLFAYEARSMVTGDFDGDGDLDIAGASFIGEVVVIENTGDLFTATELHRTVYPSPVEGKFGLAMISVADVNGDDDLDLLASGPGGTMLYLGQTGVTFRLERTRVEPASGRNSLLWRSMNQLIGNFDDDDLNELISGSSFAGLLMVSKLPTNGPAQLLFETSIPTAEFLACGDVDGDGHLDVVGAGNGLWTALSSRPAQPAPPPGPPPERSPITDHPVINEILAVNSLLPLPADQERKSDWVEIYNGSAAPVNMGGWRFRLVHPVGTESVTNDYLFPGSATLAAGSHGLLVCSDTIRSPIHTGFKLPGAGGTLSLLNAAGAEVERVPYAAQQDAISYARVRDGLRAFAFNVFPSPAQPNVDNGSIEPIVQLTGLEPATLQPDTPVRIYATASDDVGLMSVLLKYRRVDLNETKPITVVLYDDGMHGDGGMLDGQFSGLIEPGFPAGAQIEFYLEATDLSDAVVTLPDESFFAAPGADVRLYSLEVGSVRPTLEISEVVAQNTNSLHDEFGQTPDWVEIRNYGAAPVPLDGVTLAEKFFGNGDRYEFPRGKVLAPGEHFIVYADNDPEKGERHAPFDLNKDGQELYLTGTSAHGVRTLIDSVRFGPQSADVAWAREYPGGPWSFAAPTPGTSDLVRVGFQIDSQGRLVLTFRTVPGKTYTVQSTESLRPAQWNTVATFTGDGTDKVVIESMIGSQRFYRVRVN